MKYSSSPIFLVTIYIFHTSERRNTMTNLEKFKEVFGEDAYIKMRDMDRWCITEYKEPVKEDKMHEFVKWLDTVWDKYRVYPDRVYIFNNDYSASLRLSDFNGDTAYMRMDGVCDDVKIETIKKILMEFKQKEVEKNCNTCEWKDAPSFCYPCSDCILGNGNKDMWVSK